jgi:putative peptidoglycan lipid II flippase
MNSKYNLFKNASITATLSGIGVVTGVVLDILILRAFGVSPETDALFAALTVPLLLVGVLSIQCPKVLVPIFAEYWGKENEKDGWKLLSNLLTTGLFILIGISLAGIALSSLVMRLQLPGFDTQAVGLAVGMSRILFLVIPAQGLAAVLTSILYSRQSYAVASSGKMVGNIVTIAALFIGRHNLSIEMVAAGMVVGGFIQVAILLFALFLQGFRYRFRLRLKDPDLVTLLRSFRYPVSGHVLSESGTIVQNILGSYLGAGSITVIRYASRIVSAIAGILLGSVVQVTLPVIARHAALNDIKAQRKALLESLQLLFTIGLPVCVWLTLAAQPLVILMFERGEFTRENALLTAIIIQLMVPDVMLGRVVSVTQTLFYSNMDMRTPLISTVIFTVANIVFAIVLVGLFGVIGMPIAVSLASISNTVYMISKLHGRFGPIGWNQLQDFGIRLAAASALGGIGLAIGSRVASLPAVSDSIAKIINVAIPTAFGFCVFLVAAYLLRLIDDRFWVPVVGSRSS